MRWPRRVSGPRPGATARSVNYSTSPLLASKTPPWRSKLLVAFVGLGFCVLLGRAAYIQIIGTDFFQRQGEMRFASTLKLPASRGRIIDRNGQVLATSVPAPSLWAIPKDVDTDRAKRKQLAKLLDMTPAELDQRLDDNPKFVWLSRHVDESLAQQVRALKLKGVHEVREYKRKYHEGEAAAHVVGFTNLEERGQEGIELAFQKELAGRDGSRNVIKDRLGRVVEDTGNSVLPIDGRDVTLAIDSKVQFFAYQRVREAVAEHKAKAGSVVVLDVQTGEVLALANYPSFVPGDRRNLGGAQLRNRALTDTFEPGSTMKPFIAALALETGRVTPATPIQTAPGRMTIGGVDHQRRPPARHADGGRGDPEVEQRRHREDGDADAAARDVGDVHAGRLRPEAADRLSRRGDRPAAAVQDLAADRAGDDELRLRSVGVAVPDRACLHRFRARWRADSACTHACKQRTQRRAARVPRAGVRVMPADRARGARDAADGRRPGRHRAEGAGDGLFGRRQDRYRVQAGRQGLRRARSTAPGSSAWRRSATRASSSR